jgi:hypothetical protein
VSASPILPSAGRPPAPSAPSASAFDATASTRSTGADVSVVVHDHSAAANRVQPTTIPQVRTCIAISHLASFSAQAVLIVVPRNADISAGVVERAPLDDANFVAVATDNGDVSRLLRTVMRAAMRSSAGSERRYRTCGCQGMSGEDGPTHPIRKREATVGSNAHESIPTRYPTDPTSTSAQLDLRPCLRFLPSSRKEGASHHCLTDTTLIWMNCPLNAPGASGMPLITFGWQGCTVTSTQFRTMSQSRSAEASVIFAPPSIRMTCV